MVTPFALNELVNGGLLAPAGDSMYPAWMVPPASDREPNPPHGCVESFVRLHERGFTASAIHFMWGLCYHYRVELHNFTPNAISQAASFVAVCEGFLGIRRTGISGFTSFARNSTPSPRARCGRARRFVLAS
jgi:hypothetical protein